MSETEQQQQQQIVERPSSATAGSRNQHHYSYQHHIHPNLDGTYAQVKVFAAPVTLPRPGSAPSMMRSTNNNNNNNTYSLHHHQQQHNTKNGIAARSGWGGVRTPNMTSTAAFRTSSSSSQSPHNQQKRRRPQSAQQQQNISPSAQQSQQQVKGQTHREHWTHNESPGRAASEAAKQFHEVYSGQPRDEGRRHSSSRSPSPQTSGRSMPAPINTNHEAYYRQYEHVNSRPSIPDAHIQVKLSRPTSSGSAAKFPVRGRALFGNADNNNKRPSSAHSNTSSQNEGRATNNNNNNNAFPPRKIITAELTALRKKYHQANEANQNLAAANAGGFGGFGNNNYNSSSTSRSRNRNNTVSADPKKIRSQLDNIMMKINSNDSNNQTPVVDLGSGNSNNNQGTSSSRQNIHHHQVPAHIQHDNIVRRTSETARVMRREDKVAKENDRRIRNFRARALVQSATELQKAKQDTELKEIRDKLVWAKMKRDAADQELYELKMRLASLS